MSPLHSHVKLWVHLVWTTDKRQKLLVKSLGPKLAHHLAKRAAELGIRTESLSIQPEHVHCLFSLPPDKDVASVAKGLKGESSRWINEQGLVPGRFRWQRGYGAFSVSASQLEMVKGYIENQDEHHRRKTFAEEYREWLERYGLAQGVNR
ncbi:MAG: IS200/IS605 family transposase [Fidelibacterota bacterium]